MKCKLCEQTINNYDSAFNQLKIDETHTAEICSECIQKFMNWQGSKIAKLFPTKALKKRFNKE